MIFIIFFAHPAVVETTPQILEICILTVKLRVRYINILQLLLFLHIFPNDIFFLASTYVHIHDKHTIFQLNPRVQNKHYDLSIRVVEYMFL